MKSKSDFPNLNLKLPDGKRPNGIPFKAMVIDEKDFQRKQIVQIFESEGYEVSLTATNGREALDKLGDHNGKIDFITTNLDMPVLDGYALMFELKQKSIRPMVIFISEETTKGVMEDLVSMGIADYILKPIDRRIILERVKTAIKKAGL